MEFSVVENGNTHHIFHTLDCTQRISAMFSFSQSMIWNITNQQLFLRHNCMGNFLDFNHLPYYIDKNIRNNGSVNYERLSGENPSPLKVVFTLGKNNYER